MKDSKFGVATLTFLVVANMIGVGVFTSSGYAIADLGSANLVVLAWIIGGVLAIAGAISYGQLVQHIPESGGEYVFLSRAAHPILGFLAGFVSLIAGFSGAIAIAATGFETYAIPDRIRPEFLPQGSAAIAAILFAALCHGIYVRAGATLQNIGVVCKLGLLAIFVGIAISKLGSTQWEGWHEPAIEKNTFTVIAAVAGSVVWISFSYMGFNAAVYLVEEARRPAIDVPRALFLGTAIVTVLYVALNAIFVFGPPRELIAGKEDVAAVAANWLGGSSLETFIRLVTAAALLTSVTSMMMAAPRVYAKMADDGFLPAWMKAHGQISRIAITVQVVIATAIVLNATLIDQLKYLALTLSLSAAISVSCLFLPKIRKGKRLGISDIAPFVYVAGTLIACGIMIDRKSVV